MSRYERKFLRELVKKTLRANPGISATEIYYILQDQDVKEGYRRTNRKRKIIPSPQSIGNICSSTAEIIRETDRRKYPTWRLNE